MYNPRISYQINDVKNKCDPSLFNFATRDIAKKVIRFHKSLPDYKPTPLIKLTALATELDVNEIMIKDESKRFDLKAFKILGASYAIANVLGKKLKLEGDDLIYDNLITKRDRFQDITFVTATDGNHGRAVAWAANKFGCKSVVYMPHGSSPARLEAIRQFSTEASITPYNYDDTVVYAKTMAEENGWILLQDTSWHGYEEVPEHIMQGYFTLITEYLEQEQTLWPTHVFLQAGVGSFAAAIVAHFYCFTQKPVPIFVIIEPDGAPCLYESIKSGGHPYKVSGDLPTIMAGLACGEPSHMGLKILNAGAQMFVKCSDDLARLGMRILGNPLSGDRPVTSGESGAVPLGVLYQALSSGNYSNLKDALCLTKDSNILLFSTEGDTDPKAYREIVWY